MMDADSPDTGVMNGFPGPVTDRPWPAVCRGQARLGVAALAQFRERASGVTGARAEP